MDFNVESSYVVNRTDGVTTSLLVTLKAYDMDEVPNKTVTFEDVRIDSNGVGVVDEGNDEDFVGQDLDNGTVLGTRTFTYTIPEDQQTDKELSDATSGDITDDELEYVTKRKLWEETFSTGQDYITCHSHLESEVL
jgi:hypothetical protein